MKTIFVIKGISGSGKSSRVFQLILFLKEIGFDYEDFFYTNIEGKSRNIGILFSDINFLFLGKVYNSGGVERWQGYDAVTGAFKRSRHLSEFLKDNSDKFTFFIEGAGVTQTNRLRPKFLSEELGFKNIFMQYYNYEDKQDYLDRIIYRSGKVPTKATMWDKNSSFVAEIKWSNEDSIGKDHIVMVNNFDAPIYDFGVKVLIYLGMEDFVEEFMGFVHKLDYVNKNKFSNF